MSTVDLVDARIGRTRITIAGSMPPLPPHVGSAGLARARWTVGLAARLSQAITRRAVLDSPRSIRTLRLSGEGDHGATLADAPPSGAPPVLFEAMTYDAYLEWASEDGEIELGADAPGVVVEGRRFAVAAGRWSRHYRIELGNDVGILAISVRLVSPAGWSEIGRIELEVFPRKIDYQTDYQAMIADIRRIAPALVLDAAGRTSAPAAVAAVAHQTSTEWYEILRSTALDLFAILDLIDRNPQRRLDPRVRTIPTERARRIRAVDFAHALRKSGNVGASARGEYWPRRVHERTAVADFDVSGNRYIRWLLEGVITRLSRLERDLAASGTAWTTTDGGRALAARWGAEIALLRPEFQRRLRCEWLENAGSHTGEPPSPCLEAHPLYSRAFAVGRTLLRGLHLGAAAVTDVGTRPVSLLYEYWCFLAIVDLLRRHAALVQTSAIQIDLQGSRVALRRGRSASAAFRHRATGRSIRVYYNREYPTPTTLQRPDICLEIENDTGVHVFDAKYRVQFDPDYVRLYGGVGCRVDDVSTMHRYRDAIVKESDGEYRRMVKTACVLFPWIPHINGESQAFVRSLEDVGVGGLPFLPSARHMVGRRLERILQDATRDAAVQPSMTMVHGDSPGAYP